MTTTSLNDYLAQVNQLLDEEQYESVVGHGYHILKQYPRHVDTYRVLAKGLLGIGRQEEAKQFFQRILSADPNDLIAHIALADLAQSDGQSDVAQFHLERAFELDPYNSAIQEELNRYFETRDDFGIGRIQLNESSLAHLYVRGEMYDQATAILNNLLSNEKDRIDLEVLLAESLWREGNRVEAAEVSLKVLDNLPNCIVANAVLADIWFSSDRISDAKKHARNLQSMVLVDKRTIDPESIIGNALKANGAPKLPDIVQIEALETITSDHIAHSMQEMQASQDAPPVDGDSLESDPGDMYDWLSGVVKPSAEQRMEEVVEPDSWPAGDASVESDWFLDEAEDDPVPSAISSEPSMSEPALESNIDDSFEELFESESSDLADEFVLKFNEQAKEDADVPDWIAMDNSDTTQPGATEESEGFFDADQEGVPDWLSQAANEDFEPVVLDPLTASKWLNDDEDDDFDNLPDAIKETQDWLADLNQEFTEITQEEGIAADWLSEEDEPEQQDSDVDDWFSEFTDSGSQNNDQSSAQEETLESDDWLSAVADEAMLGDPVGFESEAIKETETVGQFPLEDTQTPSDDDWLSDDWLLDDGDQLAENSPANKNAQELAPTMNDKEPLKKNDAPQPDDKDKKKEDIFESDADDWLAKLTESSEDDDTDDWLADLGDVSDSDDDLEVDDEQGALESVDDFLAELQGSSNEEVLSRDELSEGLEDIDQWLEDLSEDDEAVADDWLSNLVEDDDEEPDNSGFTDWLNAAVVEDDTSSDAQLSSGEVVEEDDSDIFGLSDETGLTDILSENSALADLGADDNEDDDIFGFDDLFGDDADGSDEQSDFSDTDFLETANDTSLTDILSDAGMGLAGLDEPDGESDSFDDLLDLSDEPTFTELFGESSEEELPTTDTDILEQSSNASLTDMLSDTEQDSDENDDTSLDDPFGLTDLFEDGDADDLFDNAESDVTDDLFGLSDESGLTDLLSDAGLGFDETEEASEMPDLPEIGEGSSLTDLLSDAGLGLDEAEEASEMPDLPEIGEGSSLTDLLSDAGLGFDETEEESEMFDLPEMNEGSSLTDLLSDAGLGFDEIDEEPDDDSIPSLTQLLEGSDEDVTPVADADDELSLTDLLGGSDVDEPLDLFGDDAETAVSDDESDVFDLIGEGGLTDLLSDGDMLSEDSGEELGEDDLMALFGETAADTADSEDALETIDTNLPDWLAPSEENSNSVDSDLPDWMIDSAISADDEEEDSEPFVPGSTGLLRKLDDLPEIKASLEERAEQERAEQERAEQERAEQEAAEKAMSDFLTAKEDTAWLDQLAGTDDDQLDSAPAFDWLDNTSTQSELDWLDTSELKQREEETAVEEILDNAEELDMDDSEDIDSTPGDLDDAMSWLEDLAVEQKTPIEPLPTVAEVLDEDEADLMALAGLEEPEADDPFADLEELGSMLPDETAVSDLDFFDEEDIHTPDSDQPESDQVLEDALAEIDDAMAWLDDLDAQTDMLAEESAPVASDDAPLATVPNEEFDSELDSGIEDDFAFSEGDVPEDIDDAMAWLEQLAAKQGAPLEELPSISEDETAVIESESTIAYAEPVEETAPSVDQLDDSLAEALDWLEEVAGSSTKETTVNGTAPQTTTADLSDALDWLEEVAKSPQKSAIVVEDTVAEVEQSVAEPNQEESSETTLGDYFDMPDDPDEALAWLEMEVETEDAPLDLAEEAETTAVNQEGSLIQEEAETAVSTSQAEEEIEEEIAQPEPPVEEPEQDDAEAEFAALAGDLFDGAFDIPDDPDEALAWLEEVADDDGDIEATPVSESPTVEVTPEPLESPEPVDLPKAVEIPQTKSSTDLDDDLESDFLANVPEDPDEAMAWLEQLAARQGAPLEELPSVTEPVDEDGIPEWIKDQTDDSGDLLSDSLFSNNPVLPTLEAEQEDEADSAEVDDLTSIETSDLPEGLPDWFSLDDVAGDEDDIASQTDWLDSVPDFGGSDWLTSEGEAASTSSESIDVVPDTAPIVDTTGTGPLPDDEPIIESPETFDDAGIIEEPDSAVYKVDHDKLQVAKNAVERSEFDSAINTFQAMVVQGNGLMMLIGELENVSSEHPDRPAFRRLLGDAYMRNGQLQKALLTYREALDQL